MLGARDIEAKLDETRGFDHGVFVPLKIMHPEANIPCVQLSLVSTLDPALHIEIGHALEGLNEQNVLVIGSGFSFHNLQAFFIPDSAESRQLNESFEEWLEDVCGSSEYSEGQRYEMLKSWGQAPGARFCHPREEHLLPLHVCYGVSRAPCAKRHELTIMNKRSSMYVW
jgi:aromatic ring-opening dioxygenase catalytic subunit (LigB family)